jgi:DNA-binding MarR family transcriptional regulator
MSAPDAHLDFFLSLNRSHALISRRFDAELGGLHGVGLNDVHLLCALDEAPGRRLRRVDLARRLGLTPSGVTWLLRPLLRRRLVTDERSTDDARVAFAVLTPAGQRLVADARPSARRLARAILEEHPSQRDTADAAAFISCLGGARPPANRSPYLGSKTALSNFILSVLGDRMEMAHSVEGRVPFLDHHAVETVRDFPVSAKIRGTVEKHVLRVATRPIAQHPEVAAGRSEVEADLAGEQHLRRDAVGLARLSAGEQQRG